MKIYQRGTSSPTIAKTTSKGGPIKQLAQKGVFGFIPQLAASFVDELESKIPGGFEGAKERVTTKLKQDPLSFTPLSMRESIVPATKGLGKAVGNEQAGEDIGYGLRGALSITPMQRPKFLGGKLAATTPQTDRQEMAERIGRTAYGTALTLPLGGAAAIPARVAAGATLGAGISTGGKALETLTGEGRLPTLSETGEAIKSGGLRGIENSWILAFTQLGLDKALGAAATKIPVLAKFTSDNVPATLKALSHVTPEARGQLLVEGAKRLLGRAVLETFPENTAFTLLDKISGDEARPFAEAWMKNLPGALAGNLVYAGTSLGTQGFYNWNKEDIDAGIEALKKTLTQLKIEDIPIGLQAKDISKQLTEGATPRQLDLLKQAQDKTIDLGDIGELQTFLKDKGFEFQAGKIVPVAAKGFTQPPTQASEGVVGQPPKPDVPEQEIFNTRKLNLSESGKKRLDMATEAVRVELEDIKGSPVTNKEILEAATLAEPMKKIVPREQVLDEAARLTRLRQKVTAGLEQETITPELLDDLKTLRGQMAEKGRLLKAFDLGADPVKNDIKEQVLARILDTNAKTDQVLSAAEGVNFSSPEDVAKFYRQFVKPTLPEVINQYRYVNLLSSPKTHMVNTFSGVTQAGFTAPATRLARGVYESIAAPITGKQRQAYVSEVPAEFNGYVKAIGEAWEEAGAVIRGEQFGGRPDLSYIPTAGEAPEGGIFSRTFGKAMSTVADKFGFIPRFLEAQDVFFRKIIESGEQEALAYRTLRQMGVSARDLAQDLADTGSYRGLLDLYDVAPDVSLKVDTDAANKAAYYIYRQAIDPTGQKTGQGTLFRWMDSITSKVQAARTGNDAAGNVTRFYIPFLQTPYNILKQGVEYSPLGVATAAGAKDSGEQIAKAMVGSTVMAVAAWLAGQGDITWAVPRGEKAKQLFYDSGRKPYSIRIGDTWVSYSRIGHLAYPVALAAAYKYYNEQSPTAKADPATKRFTDTLGGIARFFSDQSYVQGIGDLYKAVSGEPGGFTSSISNIPRQLVPLVSLQGWVARILDPIYRNPTEEFPQSVLEDIMVGMPFVSRAVEPYTEGSGRELSRRPYAPESAEEILRPETGAMLLNQILPVDLAPAETGRDERTYQNYTQQRQVDTIQRYIDEGKITPEEGRKLINEARRGGEGRPLNLFNFLNLSGSQPSSGRTVKQYTR